MKAKKNRQKIPNLVVISDTHIGSKLALMHPNGALLDEGNLIMPSRFQKKIWEHWKYFWHGWLPPILHGEPFQVLLNGDLIDGFHHGVSSVFSTNIADQRQHAIHLLSEIGRLPGFEGFYVVRGTGCHVGESGRDDEVIARGIGAIKDRDGLSSRWDLWKQLGKGLIHAAHHIGVTQSTAFETSALNGELAAAFSEAGQWHHPTPDILVRSHRHRFSEVRLPSRKGYCIIFTTAAWQLRTENVYRSKQGRSGTPQLGGSIIRQGDNDLYTRHYVVDMERSEVEI